MTTFRLIDFYINYWNLNSNIPEVLTEEVYDLIEVSRLVNGNNMTLIVKYNCTYPDYLDTSVNGTIFVENINSTNSEEINNSCIQLIRLRTKQVVEGLIKQLY